MSKRSRTVPVKNRSRLAKRAKITGIENFYHPVSKSSAQNDSPVSINDDDQNYSQSPVVITISEDSPNTEAINNDGQLGVSTTLNLSEDAYHPDVKIIPPKKRKTQNVYFQEKWFKEYPWLTYDTTVHAVLCHKCATAHKMGMLSLATKSEEAFMTIGFTNWKKARIRFEAHMKSDSHRHAVSVLAAQKGKTIDVQLNKDEEEKQAERRYCLKKILIRIRLLLRQGYFSLFRLPFCFCLLLNYLKIFKII